MLETDRPASSIRLRSVFNPVTCSWFSRHGHKAPNAAIQKELVITSDSSKDGFIWPHLLSVKAHHQRKDQQSLMKGSLLTFPYFSDNLVLEMVTLGQKKNPPRGANC